MAGVPDRFVIDKSTRMTSNSLPARLSQAIDSFEVHSNEVQHPNLRFNSSAIDITTTGSFSIRKQFNEFPFKTGLQCNVA